MRTQVTESGVNIPRGMLEGVEEVEIKQQGNRIVIVPVDGEDPVLRFGRNPLKDSVADASVNLDQYIYKGK